MNYLSNWFSKAAQQEYALAQFGLGLMHYKGQGVAQGYQAVMQVIAHG